MMAQTITSHTLVLPAPTGVRVVKALAILTLVLIASIAVGLAVGRQPIDPAGLFSDSFSHTLFFRLRLPRESRRAPFRNRQSPALQRCNG